MLADSLTKPGSPARGVMASFEPRTDGDSPLIPVSSLGGREELFCSQTMCLRIATQWKIRWRSTGCCRIGRILRRFVSSCVSSMKDGQAKSHRLAKIEESLWPKQSVNWSSYHTHLDSATEARHEFYRQPKAALEHREPHAKLDFCDSHVELYFRPSVSRTATQSVHDKLSPNVFTSKQKRVILTYFLGSVPPAGVGL